MKFKVFTSIISFFLAGFVIEFNAITFRVILENHHEHEPNLFGFPFICKTSIPWVNSFEQEVYLKGLFLNLIFWFAIFYLLLLLLYYFKIWKWLKIYSNYTIIFLGILTLISFVFNPFEAKNYSWNHSFDLKNARKEIVFFSTLNEKY
jgi:hypothetical protein